MRYSILGVVIWLVLLLLALIGVIALISFLIRRARRAGRGSRPAVCPNCGVSNAEQATFCVDCGISLRSPVAESRAAQSESMGVSGRGTLCPNCGKSNPVQAKFCVGCGASLKIAAQQSRVSQEVISGQPARAGGTTFCPQCGKQVTTASRFCGSCGAVIETAGKKPVVSQGATSNQTMRIVAIIGAAVIFIGFVTPWISISGWVSGDVSALSWLKGWQLGDETLERRGEVYVALLGLLVAVAGAILAVVSARSKVLWVTIISLGGIVSILAAIWGFADIETGSEWGVSVSHGYGIWLTLLGGVLCLAGLWSLRRSRSTSH